MSVLRSLESKIAGLVEGTFNRAFRSEVRPVEIARKLAREMEEHQSHSVSRVYVPNEYAVYLSPEDRERFGGFERELREELGGYLLEHARRERFALMSKPSIEFRTDERLRLGEFGIQARLVEPSEDPSVEPSQGASGHTMIYSAAERLQEPLEQRAKARDARALLVMRGQAAGRRRARGDARPQPLLRRRARRRERLAPARGGAPARRRLVRRGSRLDERRGGQRRADRAGARAQAGRPHRARHDRPDVRAGVGGISR